MEEQEERCIQSQRAGLPQVMMMISIVLFQKQTELGSIYLEEGTDLGDTWQETQHGDIYTVLKRPSFAPHSLSQSSPALPTLPLSSVNLGALPCLYYLRSPAPPSLEALLLEHDMMGDMCAALANLRYALLPSDRLR